MISKAELDDLGNLLANFEDTVLKDRCHHFTPTFQMELDDRDVDSKIKFRRIEYDGQLAEHIFLAINSNDYANSDSNGIIYIDPSIRQFSPDVKETNLTFPEEVLPAPTDVAVIDSDHQLYSVYDSGEDLDVDF